MIGNTVFTVSSRKPRATISGSLICRLVCIKNKTKCKLQSKESAFGAGLWTVSFEHMVVASLLEMAPTKFLKLCFKLLAGPWGPWKEISVFRKKKKKTENNEKKQPT